MKYACAAATKKNARCRKKAMEDGDYCPLHQHMLDEGEIVRNSSQPDVVLFKCKIHPGWVRRLEELGVPFTVPDFAAKEAAHVEHAKQHGRDAYAIRKDVADSGTPVFGKNGLMDVATFGTFRQLLGTYNIVSVHIQPSHPKAKNQAMKVLVLRFSWGEEVDSNTSAYQEILRFVAVGNWEHCHVWENPPNFHGEIIHTVNMAHRPEGQKPRLTRQELHFSEDGWSTKELSLQAN